MKSWEKRANLQHGLANFAMRLIIVDTMHGQMAA